MTATERRASQARSHFEKLAIECSPVLLAYLARRIDPVDAAPEVLNDALLIAWKRHDRLPSDPERARMWLFVTARNCLRNYARSSRRRRLHEGHVVDLAGLTETIIPNPDAAADKVRAAVRALPERYREVVMLVHWDGFTLTDAAQVLGISASTARTRYARARTRLRAALDLGDES